MSPVARAQSEAATAPGAAANRYLPLLLLLFAGSGCAALIYEVVWFQLLQLVIGSSAVSLGLLLGAYMGGMCLGSLALPRLISARSHPLRVYALIELGIGVFGIVVLFAIPLVDRFYTATIGHGLPGIFLRGVVSAVILIPPTLLMGASLPAIARRVESTSHGVSWLGLFYGGNIAGAVFGCLLAGFYLLRLYDMAIATYVAASINLLVALAGFALAAKAVHLPTIHTVESPPVPVSGKQAVYVAIAISGLCALGAEVVWTRLLSLMLGATVYTFSIILAVFLIGLGIGSGVGSMLARDLPKPRVALGICQWLLVAAVAWTAYTLANSLPYWPINPLIAKSPWFNFELDLMRSMWAVLPAACLWGASFPLALASITARGTDPGRLVGEVYAANTVGAILGALGFSMLLIPQLGTQQSQRVLIAFSAIAALAVLIPLCLRSVARVAALAAAVLCAILLIRSVSPVPWVAVAYGRRMTIMDNPGNLLYLGEGMNSSIAVTEPEPGKRYFHVAGKVEASTETYDMRLQRMLGHLSALVHPDPHSVLVVGFGAGVTAGSFVPYPGIQKIQICELEPLIPPASTKYFSAENYDVFHDPRTSVVYDDARHYVLTTRDKFDIITSDPIHPWVKGSSTLYSQEYFELCKRHLNPGGVVTQWVPLYESDPATVKSELATFFQVFPNGTIWGNDVGGEGYDIVLLGQADPTSIDLNRLQQRLDRPDYAAVKQSLADVEFHSAISLLGTYAGRASDLQPWLAGAEINRDLNLRLQYLAGMGVNSNGSAVIYRDMLKFRTFPKDLFHGSAEDLRMLQAAFEAPY